MLIQHALLLLSVAYICVTNCPATCMVKSLQTFAGKPFKVTCYNGCRARDLSNASQTQLERSGSHVEVTEYSPST